jgi:hypothetical protein
MHEHKWLKQQKQPELLLLFNMNLFIGAFFAPG